MRWVLPVLGMLLGASAEMLRAQGPAVTEPPELVARRSAHDVAVKRASVPLAASYIKMLQDLRQSYSKQGDLEAVHAVDAELKTMENDVQEMADNGAVSRKIINGVSIVSAHYRVVGKKRNVDITPHLRRVFESGVPTLVMNTREGAEGRDPAVGEKKETHIVYTVDGRRKEIIIGESDVLDFKNDLK